MSTSRSNCVNGSRDHAREHTDAVLAVPQPARTSLCLASYVRQQRGTARIRPPHAAAERRPCSNQSLPAYNSKPTAAGLLLWAHAGTDGQRDGRTPYRTQTLLRIVCEQWLKAQIKYRRGSGHSRSKTVAVVAVSQRCSANYCKHSVANRRKNPTAGGVASEGTHTHTRYPGTVRVAGRAAVSNSRRAQWLVELQCRLTPCTTA